MSFSPSRYKRKGAKMPLESIQREFDNWEPRATTQPERVCENIAVMNCLTSVRQLIKGKISHATTIAITEHSITWLKENAIGTNEHRKIEIPVYERYIQLLNEEGV